MRRRIYTVRGGFPAIEKYFLKNKDCAIYYDDKQFSILANKRSHFYLSTLEATSIKIFKSVLCRQKDSVYTLKLAHL